MRINPLVPRRLHLFVAIAATLVNAAAYAAALPTGVDALASTAAAANVVAPASFHATFAPSLGVPEFLSATASTPKLASSMLLVSQPEVVARNYLRSVAAAYRMSDADVDGLQAFDSQRMPNGAAIVRFNNRVNGIDVFRDEVSVLVNADGSLNSIGGYASGSGFAGASRFARTPEAAIGTALQDFGFTASATAARTVAVGDRDGYAFYDVNSIGSAGEKLQQPARIKPVWFRLPDGLVPAYYVEVNVAGGDTDAYYSYVVSAQDDGILFRHNLSADLVPFSYRAWAETASPFTPLPGPQGRNGTPHPTGMPDGYQAPFVTPNLVTLVNAIPSPTSVAINDPWLADTATETLGNNADTYANLFGTNAYQSALGDFRADVTAPTTFDRTYNTAQAPQVNINQQKAAVVQLFYMVNWLHDAYYDAGFNEASRNAQTSNYGRGGNQNDPIQAQAQDVSGRNNANMTTPADGGRPVMRMYVFDGVGPARVVNNSGLTGQMNVGTAAFGPFNFDVTADVVRPAPLDACTALTNAAAVAGKIVLIDRGGCDFNAKTKIANDAGAAAVIIANVATSANPSTPPGMAASTPPVAVTIGALGINLADGDALRAAITAGTVNSRVQRVSGIDRDGTVDDGIIAHEWGHYISNRLVGNGSGLNTNQAGGLGEGFGDIHQLMLLVKGEDGALPANANFSGAYADGYTSGSFATIPGSGLVNNGYYYGIRRYPYSTDFGKNPLTYRHIVDGVALPTSPAPAFGADGGTNSEVHNTGEIWANMVWECYAGLIKDSGRLTFAQAQDRMRRYMVAGYKLMPSGTTFITARNALLSAIQSQDAADYAICGAAFARRGLGSGAVAGAAANNAGAVESYAGFGDVIFQNGFQ